MKKLPGRFGYVLNESPSKHTYFDCVKIEVKDGTIYADTGNEVKEFKVDDLKKFRFSLAYSLIPDNLRGNR